MLLLQALMLAWPLIGDSLNEWIVRLLNSMEQWPSEAMRQSSLILERYILKCVNFYGLALFVVFVRRDLARGRDVMLSFMITTFIIAKLVPVLRCLGLVGKPSSAPTPTTQPPSPTPETPHPPPTPAVSPKPQSAAEPPTPSTPLDSLSPLEESATASPPSPALSPTDHATTTETPIEEAPICIASP